MAYPDHRKARLKEERAKDYANIRPIDKFGPVLDGIHLFDKAHAVSLAEEKIVSKKIASLILEGLEEMERLDVRATRAQTKRGIHSGEAFLTKNLGFAGIYAND